MLYFSTSIQTHTGGLRGRYHCFLHDEARDVAQIVFSDTDTEPATAKKIVRVHVLLVDAFRERRENTAHQLHPYPGTHAHVHTVSPAALPAVWLSRVPESVDERVCGVVIKLPVMGCTHAAHGTNAITH